MFTPPEKRVYLFMAALLAIWACQPNHASRNSTESSGNLRFAAAGAG